MILPLFLVFESIDFNLEEENCTQANNESIDEVLDSELEKMEGNIDDKVISFVKILSKIEFHRFVF